MRKPRVTLKQTPPKTLALVGRKSPAGSKNLAGLGKGIDMPNQSVGSSSAPYKHETPQLGNFDMGESPAFGVAKDLLK